VLTNRHVCKSISVRDATRHTAFSDSRPMVRRSHSASPLFNSLELRTPKTPSTYSPPLPTRRAAVPSPLSPRGVERRPRAASRRPRAAAFPPRVTRLPVKRATRRPQPEEGRRPRRHRRDARAPVRGLRRERDRARERLRVLREHPGDADADRAPPRGSLGGCVWARASSGDSRGFERQRVDATRAARDAVRLDEGGEEGGLERAAGERGRGPGVRVGGVREDFSARGLGKGGGRGGARGERASGGVGREETRCRRGARRPRGRRGSSGASARPRARARTHTRTRKYSCSHFTSDVR
jgi:hypothetical protein